ncbi:MAG: zinc ABC transporter substrate-binding protein, partial [Actinobacteria bacterium]|nr:zinc ABC transporter substrate-binding protein [Actinomycetota bacterium]
MRRHILVFTLIATLVLTACGASTASPNSTGQATTGSGSGAKPKRILATFTVIADMAENVAGDAAIVESITKPGTEIHDYEPTPSDIVRAQQADLVHNNGLGLERWFEK